MGIAAHWGYKTQDNKGTGTELRATKWLSGLIDLRKNLQILLSLQNL